MPSRSPITRFRKLQSFKTDFAPATITLYESERTGMQIIVADRQGPKINGYFTLATEITDDSGAPHTLEHLVFMGSRSYQYKGLLDKLASRAYSGTNAWTATDHTAYTLETAGWDGFAQILPIYLEHVLLPTLTDEGCLTEVHYIDGEGNDAGVVYSEMQALQYSSGELMDLRMRRLLYPEDIGFRYETGGMPDALRVLTADRIREFHKDMYQPRNMAVIIVGETNHTHLLEIMDKFEESVQGLVAPADKPYKRPFIDSPQPAPIARTTVEVVEFPEEDESIGEVLVAWFGPSCTNQVQATAVNLLLTYLCGSSVSVLENIMVEKEELASSISYSWDARPNSVVWMQPTGVATEKLAFVEQRLHDLLREVASKPLDMTYMREIIGREKRQVHFQAEGSEGFYSNNIITDYLFGKRDGSTLLDLQSLSEYDVLMEWTDTDWRKFLSKWLVDANHISVLGKPSMKMANQLKAAEEARLAKRREELGEEGLKEWGRRVEEAKAKNDRPIPEHVLSQWEVPGTESIHFIESLTARSGRARQLGEPVNDAQKIIDSVAQGRPLFIQFENVPTNFVHITLHIGTASIPNKLKPLMPLFADNFFNTPVLKNGRRMDFESVVMQLEKETVSYAINGGSRIGDPEAMMMQFIVEPDKYETIIEWIRTMMFDSIFDPMRIKACLMKALADLPEAKRDGRAMAAEVEMSIHLMHDSFPLAKRTLVKAIYFKRLLKLLEREPETVLSWFEDLRQSIFTFENIRLLVTANLAEIPNSVSAWDVLTEKLDVSRATTPIVPPYTLLSEEGRKPGNHGAVIVPMTTLDSSYSVSTAAGLSSYADPRLPAYLVALGYLEAVEGPLWNAVRGNGLAYGTVFSREINAGYIQYRVYRSPDASKALEASKVAVEALATGATPLDKHLVEGAVSGIVMAFADDQATMAAAAQQNFVLEVIRGLDANWTQEIMRQVRDVSHDEIRKVMKELLLPVFYPGTSNVVVTCQPLMEQNIEKALSGMGYTTQVQQLSHFYEDYGLEGNASDDDEDDDEDEDEAGQSGEEGGSQDESGEEQMSDL